MDETNELYRKASVAFGAMMRRLARGYETDQERRRDLLQEIHIELWRSLRSFDGRCSLQTWIYRVAHNVGASHIARQRRAGAGLVNLEALEAEVSSIDGEEHANQQYSVSRLLDRIHLLKPLDRQVMLLYLEGEAAASIAEVTGLSAVNVATKIHRLKKMLSRESGQGGKHGGG